LSMSRDGKDLRKLSPDVITFLDRASKSVGRIHEETFSQFTFSTAIESLESPIEDLFFIACAALAESVLQPLNIQLGVERTEERGAYIRPQTAIGPYRVDFLLWQNGIAPEEIYRPVIVELDGHDFHDKNKRQRSYEKARDRYLVRANYRVLHFTGGDVVSDPFKAAHEALGMLGVLVGWSNDEYDHRDPLRIGE
jgi:very-short-patch-repair endonuclease